MDQSVGPPDYKAVQRSSSHATGGDNKDLIKQYLTNWTFGQCSTVSEVVHVSGIRQKHF